MPPILPLLATPLAICLLYLLPRWSADRGRRFFARLEVTKYCTLLAAVILLFVTPAGAKLMQEPNGMVPVVFTLAIFFTSTAVGFHRLGQTANLRPGPPHCNRCGYNLTANVSGICPECGTATR